MLRAMLRDLRAHLGRVAMTLAAIVLGVAFVVGHLGGVGLRRGDGRRRHGALRRGRARAGRTATTPAAAERSPP